jgi:hypothetical protein
VCVAEGFPSLPFFVNRDLTRPDGIIRCREITTPELLKLSWKALRLLKYIRIPPIPF